MAGRLLGVSVPRQDPDASSLLSAVGYDDDAASLHSSNSNGARSDQDSDSDDDALQQRARNSRELAAHDRIVLLEQEEADQLVAKTRRRGGGRGGGGAGGARRGGGGGPGGGGGLAEAARQLTRRLSGSGNLHPSGIGTTNTTAAMTREHPIETDRFLDHGGGGGGDDKKVTKKERRKREKDRKREKKKKRKEEEDDKAEALAAAAAASGGGGGHGEDGALMYEMEEGAFHGGSETGSDSDPSGEGERDEDDENGRRRLLAGRDGRGAGTRTRHHRRTGRDCCYHWLRMLLLAGLAAVGLALLALAAWRFAIRREQLQQDEEEGMPAQRLLSNGTELFAPTTIIISLDGFRADFLHRGITPRLSQLIQEGVSPKYMLPSFPSVTFPNHYTLATGLYPESHGIVGNSFWDPALGEEFFYKDPARSLDAKWWGGEPFWVTAERSGVRTAIHMWPGSEAHILGVEPSILDRFRPDEPLPSKVDRVLELLDMARPDRPQIIAAYVPNVDSAGHRHGPNSTEIRATIRAADDLLDGVFRGLQARNLTAVVNVMVVSDHGMATTDTSRLLQLEDLIGDEDDLASLAVDQAEGWPLFGLRPRNESSGADVDMAAIYGRVAARTADNPNVEVYLRDGNMPTRFHFSRNSRIAPLWLVPRAGWAIVTRREMVVADAIAAGSTYHPRGLHGYDHEDPLMRAIFVARGPAFPHPGNSEIESFENINVYNMLCDSVGLTPRPNNGTLRLPLRPMGLHQDGDELGAPADPAAAASKPGAVAAAAATASSLSVAAAAAASSAAAASASAASASTPPESESTASADQEQKEDSEDDENSDEADEAEIAKIEQAIEGFWDWVAEHTAAAWGKITDKLGGNVKEG